MVFIGLAGGTSKAHPGNCDDALSKSWVAVAAPLGAWQAWLELAELGCLGMVWAGLGGCGGACKAVIVAARGYLGLNWWV